MLVLGIPNVGVKTAKDLVNTFKSLEGLKDATFDRLVGVNDVGDIVAMCVLEFFKEEKVLNTEFRIKKQKWQECS